MARPPLHAFLAALCLSWALAEGSPGERICGIQSTGCAEPEQIKDEVALLNLAPTRLHAQRTDSGRGRPAEPGGLMGLAQKGSRGNAGDNDGLASSLTFSSVLGARSTTAYSPELQSLLHKIDEKMKPLAKPLLSQDDCDVMSEKVAESTARVPSGPAVIHTGVLMKPWRDAKGKLHDGVASWQDGGRKIRLQLLSLLATQNLETMKIRFWTDVERDHPVLKEALRPLLRSGKYARNIEVTKFDPEREFAKVLRDAGNASDNSLTSLYNYQRMESSRSNLMRFAALYNYGGMWIDTDVLMLRNAAPVMDFDWAYLGQANFVNNAVLGTSKPRSPFMKAYLAAILTRNTTATWSAYGPQMVSHMARQIQDSGVEGSFHVLPVCFFDGAWGDSPDVMYWDEFFSKEPEEENLAYILPNDGSTGAFAYHWHGRWDKPIMAHSLAAWAEKYYAKRLHIVL